MTTATMTLTEFLLARIAEDEAVAGRAVEDHYMVEGGLRWCEVGYETSPDLTIDPARVLAECEAKRRMVTIAAAQIRLADSPAVHWDNWHDMATQTLAALAAVYADHPDYREEWRP